MKLRRGLLWAVACAGVLAVAAGVGVWDRPGAGDGLRASAGRANAPPRREALSPLPPVPPLSADKVALGRRLFLDVRLSKDDTLACVSCHDPKRGGADGLPVSVGVGGRRGTMNAPSVFNASLNLAQFWDGRADTLEAQVAGPIHNPAEMDSSWAQVLSKLGRDADYVAAFARLYPGRGLGADTLSDAIATYERTLLTPNSRFDKYLGGDRTALSPAEVEGYRLFLEDGCAACHQGANIGGNMYQRFGAVGTRPAGMTTTPPDLGRFNVTHREQDRHVFKVPSLRNVAVTSPYFHDGHVARLDEAVAMMGRAQLGRELSPGDIERIVAFLGTLTGEWNGRPLP